MKKKENWALGLSILAIVISGLAVWLSKSKVPTFTFEGTNLLISVLTATVTIYMFVHIINELFLERKIRRSVKEDIDESSNNILYHNMYLTIFFQGVNELRQTHCEAALFYLFKSIECLMKTNIDNDKLDEIMLKIKTINNDFPATKISKQEANEYIKIIASTEHKDKDEIVDILNLMRE